MVIGLAFLLVFIVIQQVDDFRNINIEKQIAIDISKAKTRFLASMSHEIRTPINAILGMNEMILRENRDSVIEEYSRNIKTSGKMLLMLVNDVLDFSKIEAGKMEINNSRFLMSDMLYDVISLVKERADEKNLTLDSELACDIPDEIISDEFRIRQILINLLNNAVKYTDKGSVKLILDGKYSGTGEFDLRLTVKDTGKGIRKEDQKHLFEAFSRADAKSNANIEGTGLGLAIVNSIVESMKGSLGVESEYGAGSEFWVTLPVKYSGGQLLDPDFINNRSKSAPAQETCGFMAPDAEILAVDDNRSNLTIVRLFLKRTGINPDLCDSGTRAIELCREKKYDLIILDHMMPQPDGLETLRLIRNDEASLNKDTKAVVLTANAIAGSRQLYLDAGFSDYLTKPLDSKLLEQAVRNMLPAGKVILTSDNSSSSEAEDNGFVSLTETRAASEDATAQTASVAASHTFADATAQTFSGSASHTSADATAQTFSGSASLTSGDATAQTFSGSASHTSADATAQTFSGSASHTSGDATAQTFSGSASHTSADATAQTMKEAAGSTSAGLKQRLSSIDGMDYDTALYYSGGSETALEMILSAVIAECSPCSERMRQSLETGDFESYGRDAHSIKSNMATIGLKEFSERAKKHEFAAKDNDTAFIRGDSEDFLSEYTSICRKLDLCLPSSIH